MAQHQQLYELLKKARLVKGKKTSERGKALETRVAALEAKTDKSSNESLFSGKKFKVNRNNSAHDREGNGTRQSHADT